MAKVSDDRNRRKQYKEGGEVEEYGGNVSNVKQDDIEYITIATLGNGSPFGDLTAVRQGTGGCAAWLI